jgi:hypothetical protein
MPTYVKLVYYTYGSLIPQKTFFDFGIAFHLPLDPANLIASWRILGLSTYCIVDTLSCSCIDLWKAAGI